MSFITGYFDSLSDNGTPNSATSEDNYKPFKLWAKPDKSILPTKENPLLTLQLGKKNNQRGKISDRTFVVTKSHLIYTKTNSIDEYRGALSLVWTRVSFH
jgi:hypothetical protein